MVATWTFNSAGGIIFGCGALERLGPLVVRYGAKRVMVVTDSTLESVGVAKKVNDSLAPYCSDVEMFAGGTPEPSLQLTDKCFSVAKLIRPEVLIGVGGGSNMDLAKVTALRLTHGGATRDYLGEDRVPGPVMPVVCVPTTAGSGSEVTGSVVLTDIENQVKVAILSNFLRPRAALIDPELALSCPAKVTAESGIDALVHAFEAYTAIDYADAKFPEGEETLFPGCNPMGQMVAAQGIQHVARFLVDAVKQPDDLDARTGMAMAAMLGGLAFSNACVALVHAMEYPLGGLVHCSHGQGNGLLLPYVMRFNSPTRTNEFAQIAGWLGEEVNDKPVEQAAQQAVMAVERLNNEIGIPKRLSDIGVRSEDILPMAEKAFSIKRLLRFNPRHVDLEDIVRIYSDAL